jgi:hypothetical protein
MAGRREDLDLPAPAPGFEHRQLPAVDKGVMADDVDVSVSSQDLEVSVVRGEPAVQDVLDIYRSITQVEPPRRFFAPVPGMAIDPDILKRSTVTGHNFLLAWAFVRAARPTLSHFLLVSGELWLDSGVDKETDKAKIRGVRVPSSRVRDADAEPRTWGPARACGRRGGTPPWRARPVWR